MNAGYIESLYSDYILNNHMNDAINMYQYNFLSNQNIQEFVEKDKYPIPQTDFREGYYGDFHLGYWLSGLNDFLALQNLSEKYNFSLLNIMDYGSASGRIIRHFLTNTLSNLYASDLNTRHMEYINTYLNTGDRKIITIPLSSDPIIPLDSNFFDFIYSYSVFTHIDNNEILWLKELHRLLKDGQYALITVHSEHTWNMLPNIFVYKALKQNRLFQLIYNEKNSANILKIAQKLVFKYNEKDSYNCNVFHHSDFILNQWSLLFDVIEIIPYFHSYQTGVLLRKK